VARLTFTKDPNAARDPLSAHVLARRSNREPFDSGRTVASETLEQIASVARTGRVAHAADPARLEALRALSWEAMVTELKTPGPAKETVGWMRIGRAEIEANPDGISLAGAMLEGLVAFGLFDRNDLLDPNSSGFRLQLDTLKPQFDTAMAFLWLVTPGNSRADQIAAGRDYVRLNLAATGAGIAMQPFSQALQEYPEMQPHFAAMRQSLGIGEDETLQMFVRLGYGPDIKGAPRWPLDARIRSA
jgi:hypothetical protein